MGYALTDCFTFVMFQPVITMQEVSAGLALTPKEQVVTVKSSPVLGITFSQFRATVTGTVKCIGELLLGCLSELVGLFLGWEGLQNRLRKAEEWSWEMSCLGGEVKLVGWRGLV